MANPRPKLTTDLLDVAQPMIFILPLDEIYAWMRQMLGPMAAEILEILAACVCDDELHDGRAPPAFRRLHRTLMNQGLDRYEAEALMRQAYVRLTAQLSAALPEWMELEHYYGLEHSMRGHQTLLLVVHPESTRVRAYA